VQAILGTEAQQHGLAAEEHHRQLGIGVLEGEVNVAGGGGTEVGDFALDPYVSRTGQMRRAGCGSSNERFNWGAIGPGRDIPFKV
jgi:hypothetical protein